MSFPRYPRYKPSGVEWLGDVPEHWEVKRLCFATELNPSKSEVTDLDRDMPVSFLPMEAVGDDGTLNLESEKTIGELESGYTYFRDGDVTVAKITPCYENGKGALMRGLKNGIGFGTTELIVARPKPEQVTGPYLRYLFISPDFRSIGESHMYGAGGQKRVPDAFVRNFATAFPPLAEQTAIAKFLDRETGKIDELVAEQRRLMELLKEKRQAVISHAVTRGLNPAAPLKSSGIEWLGDVPEHWKTSRLKYAAARIVDCPHETPTLDDDGDYLTIRTADIDDGKIFPDQMRRVDENEYLKRIRREPLLRHDIVYSREGERWGHAALVEEDNRFCLGQRMMQFRAAESFCPEYLMWQLNSQSVYWQGEVDTVGATAPHVNVATIRNYMITEPPMGEQREIASFLNEKSQQFDTLTAEAQRAIDLLQERRTALISAAVTGQIDVRAFSAKKTA